MGPPLQGGFGVVELDKNTPLAGGHMGPPLQGGFGVTNPTPNSPVGAAPCGGPKQGSLSQIMDWYKTMTTNVYIRGVKEHGWPRFKDKLWQRSFNDHIIRSEKTHDNIREYISRNSYMWELDAENKRIDADRERYYKKLYEDK